MIDLLRDMIHKLEARVATLEAQAPKLSDPHIGVGEVVYVGDGDAADDTIQPDDPTNEDDNG